jgi:hypothetical protein
MPTFSRTTSPTRNPADIDEHQKSFVFQIAGAGKMMSDGVFQPEKDRVPTHEATHLLSYTHSHSECRRLC